MPRKYTEDNLQKACARYLDMQGLLWCHVANERSTSPRSGANLKAKGVKRGVPDILIFEPKGPYKGLAVELKVKPNKPTKFQNWWLDELKKRNWKTAVCYDIDEFLKVISEYRSNNFS